MNPIIIHDEAGSLFRTEVDGHTAMLGYRLDRERMSIMITEVPPPIEGRVHSFPTRRFSDLDRKSVV